jgi:DNA-binding NarL/FixJ family response regulator
MTALRQHQEADVTHGYVDSSPPAGGAAGKLIYLDGVRRSRLSPRAPVSPTVRVVIAGGHALVRAGFRVLLASQELIAVVGEAASGEETVELARRTRPDVVLMDANVPGLDCVEATRRILAESGVPVMLLTDSESEDRIFAALRAGASGLLLKDAEPEEFVHAVEVVARGEGLLSPSLTRRLIAEFASRPEPSRPASDLLEELTAREREVVALVALGLSNDEIAERLVVSRATAKTHVSRAMVKLHARDRAQLVVFAYETGLAMPRTHAPAAAGARLALA